MNWETLAKKTRFWIEEFSAPNYVLADTGPVITIASPADGQPPVELENPVTLTTHFRFELTKKSVDNQWVSLVSADRNKVVRPTGFSM